VRHYIKKTVTVRFFGPPCITHTVVEHRGDSEVNIQFVTIQ